MTHCGVNEGDKVMHSGEKERKNERKRENPHHLEAGARDFMQFW